MLRDQMITFLETTVIFLLLTNAVSAFAAAYAIAVANGAGRKGDVPTGAVVRRAQTVFSAMWPDRTH